MIYNKVTVVSPTGQTKFSFTCVLVINGLSSAAKLSGLTVDSEATCFKMTLLL